MYQNRWNPYTDEYSSIWIIEFFTDYFVSYHMNKGSKKKDGVCRVTVDEQDMKFF